MPVFKSPKPATPRRLNCRFFLTFCLVAPLAAQVPLRNAEHWVHGVPTGTACAESLQVHEAGPGTFILRENKCVNFEAPFLYLILGETQALLLDTGAKPAEGVAFPLVATVDRLIRDWEAQRPGRKLRLLVAHTHGHRDHRFLDDAFRARADTSVVGYSADAVKDFFRFTHWPESATRPNLFNSR